MAIHRSAGCTRASLLASLCAAFSLVASLGAPSAHAQEPAACLSPDPAVRPAPAKPYFLIIADTSSSLNTDVGSASTCGLGVTRTAHERCALRNVIGAYGGLVNFGLATYATQQSSCAAACSCAPTDPHCFAACSYSCSAAETATRGVCAGCGARPGVASTAAGLMIRVPLLQDHFWSAPPDATNVPALLGWFDGACGGDRELFAAGNTPLNGSLRDAARYLRSGWTSPDGLTAYPTPLSASDRPCRSVNVVLITDGDENCDTQADAVAAATDLFTNGATIGSSTYRVRVHVINFAGASQVNMSAIASAGGTGAAYFAANETEIGLALDTILGSAMRAESCNNVDDDCNGCTDEGFAHYCDVGQTCCAWGSAAQRNTCLSSYTASISPANPRGNTTLLPCTTAAQATAPATWLCFDPRDICDNLDNNCSSGVDEGALRCGSPSHCPVAETCNGLDDNCNGVVDDGGVCMGCVPSQEICDGCDNDCDGIADDGVAAVPCGSASPGNCVGTMACRPAQPVPTMGACVAGGGFLACSNNPIAEVCDGVDSDCDGIADDSVASSACVPVGTPGGLVFGGASACVRGSTSCMSGATTCGGFVGPTAEICNGIDDNCNGVVDEGVPGVGASCGSTTLPCRQGVTACVSGALVCQGATGGTPERCNGIDDDCNGAIDDGALADAPPAGSSGCWSGAGNCCSFGALSWCPPPGATCSGGGSLNAPCGAGLLACTSGAWSCAGARAPSAESCDGIDQDCNGVADDGTLPGVGAPCSTTLGACVAGVLRCASGVLACSGVSPTLETCNSVDDDCDGTMDEALGGATCTLPYDTVAFPGVRTAGLCHEGVTGCASGSAACVGAVGPSPELCNGIDDDCDGTVDETGSAPDGIDGSASPEDATAIVGATCGAGSCGSAWTCTAAQVRCVTSTASAEICNCLDDDCDGTVDEDGTSLCGTAGTCAQVAPGSCACAAACTTTADCPVGRACADATASGTGTALGLACLPDVCGDCSARWIESGGVVECAPAGTELTGCVVPPICTCTASGCASPCEGVTCPAGQACAERGANAGTCITPHCPEVSCNACGSICAPDGSCVDDPCVPSPCPSGSACTPSTDLLTFTCAALPDAGSAVDAGTAAHDAGAMDAGGDAGAPIVTTGACGCSVPLRSGGVPTSLLWLGALGLVLALRRRARGLAVAAVLVAVSLALAGCTSPSGGDDSGGGDDGSVMDGSARDARVDGASPDALDAAAIDGATDDACVAATEVCNGRDDDCDGVADDVVATDLRTCGGCGHDCTVLAVGCARDGVTCDGTACGCAHCAPGLRDLDGNGTCESTCAPSTALDDQCDGIDDDCDGTRDEDANLCVAPNCGGCGNDCATLHGVGQCSVTGTSCGAGDARCTIASCECTGPTHCWHDLDGLASTGCEYACSPTNGGVEICDGLDNDCDGHVDAADDLSSEPRVGVSCAGAPLGLCASPAHAGTTACVAGAIVCGGANVIEAGSLVETCNGLDDDCDGAIDDAPTDAGSTCGTSSTTPCVLGRMVCTSGALACVGATLPSTETCNGRDDDCNGTVDDGVAGVGAACSVPPSPPAGATSPCRAGTMACSTGAMVCAGATGPTSTLDACGFDANCDGTLTNQPDLTSDVNNCGICGRSCVAGAVHARWGCASGTCAFQGCQPGYYDLDGDQRCEYPCAFASSVEACNGIDDNCNGQIDEAVVAPSPTQVCGVSPSALTAECTSSVSVACVAGAWSCTFLAGVCTGGCSANDEICDTLDNDCDGILNENVPNFGLGCASDDGLPPPGDGLCRTTGTYICNGASATRCSATRVDCATLPGGCTELCDGLDNDCDGVTDEPFTAKGSNAANFVRPVVTRIAAATWMYSFEASRPTATTLVPGMGNGYHTSAPAGRTLDRTRACSVASHIPWTNVTPLEATQTCAAMGGTVCSPATWTSACQATTPCSWGYNPRGVACTSSFTSTRFCNLGPSYDFDPSSTGDQDGLLVTASALLGNCWADWSALQGNSAATNRIYDITGNVREIVVVGVNAYRGVGGSYLTSVESGASCTATGAMFDQGTAAPDLGFRCCFSADPTL